MASTSGVRLFEADPELLERIPEAERAFALRSAIVAIHRADIGGFDLEDIGRPPWGALIIDGLLACEVGVAGSTAAELLGAGDLFAAPSGPPQAIMVQSEATWTVLEPLTLVLLDERFPPIARRWPELTACLLERSHRRAARLAVTQAIGHLTRVDTRVLVMLWVLAERWGRVGSDAIVLPLRLTHRTLARLVGARRPSVTTAITELTRRDLLARRDDGAWLLHGPPPAELERVGVAPEIHPAPPATPTRLQKAHRMADQIRVLATAYEHQARRAQTLAARSEATRARSRVVRDEVVARRDRISPRSAPPAA
jgi:CRP/FNR family cyclic AMP-dependent transcriptional regulator